MQQQKGKRLLKCKMEHNPVVFVQKNDKHFKCPNCGAHFTKEIDLSTFIRELSPTVLWNARSKNVTVYVEKETPLLLSNVKYLMGQGFKVSVKSPYSDKKDAVNDLKKVAHNNMTLKQPIA